MNLDIIRTENKYILSAEEALLLARRLDTALARDVHCAEGPYPVRSLYFDTLESRDFITKLDGDPVRRKIRLRTYAPGRSPCRLEMKEKKGVLQRKLGLPVSHQAATRLMNCDYSALTRYMGHGEKAAVREATGSARKAVRFYTAMTLGCYRPVTMVEYRRLAFVYPYGDVRLTLDSHIRCSESNFDLFDTDSLYSCYPEAYLEDRVILEVKFSGQLPGFISRALQPFHLTQTAASKYMLSRPAFYEYML